jgi:hypothetical protein
MYGVLYRPAGGGMISQEPAPRTNVTSERNTRFVMSQGVVKTMPVKPTCRFTGIDYINLLGNGAGGPSGDGARRVNGQETQPCVPVGTTPCCSVISGALPGVSPAQAHSFTGQLSRSLVPAHLYRPEKCPDIVAMHSCRRDGEERQSHPHMSPCISARPSIQPSSRSPT